MALSRQSFWALGLAALVCGRMRPSTAWTPSAWGRGARPPERTWR